MGVPNQWYKDAGQFGKKAALTQCSKLVELNWGGEVGKIPPCQPFPREVWLVSVMLGTSRRLRMSRRAHWGTVGNAGHGTHPSNKAITKRRTGTEPSINEWQ